MPKGYKEIWKQYAEKRNESLNSYIFITISKLYLIKIRKIPAGLRKHRNTEIDTMKNRRNAWK